MPLSINVGLSRKASRDYQSTGVSINVTAELDQSLLARPAELQAQIDALYAQAEQALDRQVQAPAESPPPPQCSNGNSANRNTYRSNGHRNGYANSNGHGNGRRTSVAMMTASQRRAIESICQRQQMNAEQEAHELHGVTLQDLTIRQASELIDHLKGQPAGTPQNGGGR